MLKKIVIGLAVLVALVLAGGFLMPSGWKVERSVVIAAAPETIAPAIVEPKQWSTWAAWNNDMDPEAKWTFFGPASGAGASMAWTGPKLGKGLLTITSVEPMVIGYRMQMEGNLTGEGEQTKMEGGSPASGTFTFTAEAGGTRVTWLDQGDMGMNVIGRYFVPMLNKMLGQHFETGLAKLKTISEQAQAKKAAAPAVAAPADAAPAEVLQAAPATP